MKAADLAEFSVMLGELAAAHGVSYRDLAKRVGHHLKPPRPVGKSTIHELFTPGRRRLSLDLVVAVVRALGLPEEGVAEWREACVRLHGEAKAGGAHGVFRQLPSDLAAFTGRQDVVRRVRALAEAAEAGGTSVVISAIEGMAGIGKTQLAVHVAHELVRAGRFGEVQLFVNLHGFDPDRPPADPAAVLDAFLRQLGVAAQHVPQSTEERAAMFRDRMHGRDALVVLDNAADEEQVRDLIPASPACLVLITSRRSLSGLEGAALVTLDVLGIEESVQLLARIAGDERVAAEPEAARRIAELCGGLPLAVSLAAARLRSRPAWRLVDLASRLGEITVGGRLAAVFDLSYRGLPDAARRVFRLLGIDPGMDATAGSVAALAGIGVEEADRWLELLQDENLIGQRTPGRFELHDLLRAYAAELCQAGDSAAEREAALTRWTDWYLRGANAAMDVVNPSRNRAAEVEYAADLPPLEFAADPESGAGAASDARASAVIVGKADAGPLASSAGADTCPAPAVDRARAWLVAERVNLLAATRYAAGSGRAPHAWRFSQVLWSFYWLGGHTADWAESRRHGLAAAEAVGDAFGQAELWHAQGIADAVAGRYDCALRHTREALRFREVVGDRGQLGATLLNLACVHHDLGQLVEAVEIHRQALVVFREVGNPRGVAQCLQNLGLAAAELGRNREAVERLSEALGMLRGSGTAAHLATTLGSLGLALNHLGEHDRALEAATEAVDIAEGLGASKQLAEALIKLAVIHTDHHRYAEAERLLERGRQVGVQMDLCGVQVDAVLNLGVNALRSGEPATAAHHLAEARSLLEGQEGNRWAPIVAQYTGDAHLALGDAANARDEYTRVLTSERASSTVPKSRATYGMARIALAQSPPDRHEARRRLLEAQLILADAQVPLLEQEIVAALADVVANS